MPKERAPLQIPMQKLLIGLVLTVIPISLAGLLAIHSTERSLQADTGRHFKTISEGAAVEVSNLVHGLVRSLGAIAIEPEIVGAAAASDRTYEGLTEAAISERIQKTEKAWNTPAGAAETKAVLSSPAAQLLRRHKDLDRRILRVTVTDEKGATVAATHKTEDYYQGDEEYWQNIYASGRGAISITDILFDAVTKSYYIGVGLPLMDPASNRFLGTMDVLVDVSSLHSIVNRVQVGPTGRMLLVKDDGTVIASPTATLADRLKSEEYAAVTEMLASLQGRQTGYVVADVRGGTRTLIGFADTGLRADYGKLGWVILLAQDAREAFAATRMVVRLMAFMAAVGIIGVTLLAMYFSLHKRQDIVDLHELKSEARSSHAG